MGVLICLVFIATFSLALYYKTYPLIPVPYEIVFIDSPRNIKNMNYIVVKGVYHYSEENETETDLTRGILHSRLMVIFEKISYKRVPAKYKETYAENENLTWEIELLINDCECRIVLGKYDSVFIDDMQYLISNGDSIEKEMEDNYLKLTLEAA